MWADLHQGVLEEFASLAARDFDIKDAQGWRVFGAQGRGDRGGRGDVKGQWRRRYAKHREQILAKGKAWREANRERVREYKRAYRAKRKASCGS